MEKLKWKPYLSAGMVMMVHVPEMTDSELTKLAVDIKVKTGHEPTNLGSSIDRINMSDIPLLLCVNADGYCWTVEEKSISTCFTPYEFPAQESKNPEKQVKIDSQETEVYKRKINCIEIAKGYGSPSNRVVQEAKILYAFLYPRTRKSRN